MANNTGKKFGGRQKGSLNKKSQVLKEKANELGVDVGEFLLLTVKGDVRLLGYEDRVTKHRRRYDFERARYEEANAKGLKEKKTKPYPDYVPPSKEEALEMNLLPIDERRDAAKDIAPYIYPKLRPVDHKGNTGLGELEKILNSIDGTDTSEDGDDEPEE